jgi:membrane protease YdiL (CAAX protease family)
MIVVFSFTYAMGILLAYAYARTFSIWIPFAIHFGWNLTQNYIFPDTAMGNHIFILASPPPLITVSYLAFFTMLLLPKIAILVIDFLIVKQYRQVEMPLQNTNTLS